MGEKVFYGVGWVMEGFCLLRGEGEGGLCVLSGKGSSVFWGGRVEEGSGLYEGNKNLFF